MRRIGAIIWEIKTGADAWCSHAIAWEIMVEQGAFKCRYEGANRAREQEVSRLVDPL